MLDLTYLASGYRQHVFTRTGEDDGWVYKIPVAFGRVLPFDIRRLEGVRPRSALQRTAQLVLLHAPNAVLERVERAADPLGGRGGGRALAAPAAHLSRRLRALRERVLVAYYSRRRLRDFRRMLMLLETLGARQAEHPLLPYRLITGGRAQLRLEGGGVLAYRGPILVQKRASIFRVTESSLRAYAWDELVEAQQFLWMHGLALLETGEILGPRSWTRFEGRLRLADTSSLTADDRLARRSLNPARLDERERVIAARLREERSEFPVEDYFRRIRAEINLEMFDRLWQSAIRRSPA